MTYDYYIRIGGVGDHPFLGHPNPTDNLKQCFPKHDFNSGPPDGFVPFIWVDPPTLGPYEKWDDAHNGEQNLAYGHNGLAYELIDGVGKHVWHTVPMTLGEKDMKINAVKTYWHSDDGPKFDSWTFNETTCEWDPPTPRPECTEKIYWDWDESSKSWKKIDLDAL